MKEKKKEQKTELSAEFIRMYFEHQYERMAQHEQQRLIISNIVLSLSTLVFTFGFTNLEKLTVTNGIVLPLIVVLSNIFAIVYNRSAGEWISLHRSRAKILLETYANELFEKIDKPRLYPKKDWRGWKVWWTTWNIIIYIHILLIIVAILLPLFVFLS